MEMFGWTFCNIIRLRSVSNPIKHIWFDVSNNQIPCNWIPAYSYLIPPIFCCFLFLLPSHHTTRWLQHASYVQASESSPCFSAHGALPLTGAMVVRTLWFRSSISRARSSFAPSPPLSSSREEPYLCTMLFYPAKATQSLLPSLSRCVRHFFP